MAVSAIAEVEATPPNYRLYTCGGVERHGRVSQRMSTMSLEHSFRRLALRPSSICNQCRRTFASSAPMGQQQSATAAFHGTNSFNPS